MDKKIIFIFVIFFLICCNKNSKSKYDGLWLIETAKISDSNVIKYFHVNSIKFDSKTNKATVPGSYFAERDLNVDWNLFFHSDEKDSIKIVSKNWIFNRNFEIFFYAKENKQCFIMKSDSIYIEGYNAFK